MTCWRDQHVIPDDSVGRGESIRAVHFGEIEMKIHYAQRRRYARVMGQSYEGPGIAASDDSGVRVLAVIFLLYMVGNVSNLVRLVLRS